MDSFQIENLWNFNSEFDNFQLFNTLSNSAMYQPLTEFQEIKPTTVKGNSDFMSVFAGGKNCKNALRLLSTEHLRPADETDEKEESDLNYFCMYSQNENTHSKKFALLPYHIKDKTFNKVDLSLDNPNKVLVINKRFLVAVEKKCITLYRIHNEHLIIKDFDSVGIGNQLIVADLQHTRYKGKDYLLVFGNEKEDVRPFFKCLVYQLEEEKLKFIKKATIFQRQHYKSVIVFDHYPGREFVDEQFCLVLGGFSDYEQENYNFSALQIHLHLLLEEWVEYPLPLTHEVLFKKKHTITSGKGIKITTDISRDQFWLIFCTEYQTISKMDFIFGHHDDEYLLQSVDFETKTLKVRDEKTGQFEPIHYCENSIYMLRVPSSTLEGKQQIPYRIYWCSKGMEKICSRPLTQLLKLFWNN